jgi:FkbM family methyltransferase
MKFYYGYGGENYVDVTHIVFDKCFKDDGMFIPVGEGERVRIIGYDPYPNILKHIKICDEGGDEYIFTSNEEIRISFPSVREQLRKSKQPKIWWNTVGKFIEDPTERLDELHKHLSLYHRSFNNGGFELEYPEQLMVMRYLKEGDKVLEIGGNIGRTSNIIQTILTNPRNHVIMECDEETAKKLRFNLDQNGYTEVGIETYALSKSRLYNIGGVPKPVDGDVPEGLIEVPSICYSALCEKYGIDFDVLVADCEGSLYYIFGEDPGMLDRIHTVIMENDYTELSHKKAVDDILRGKGFRCVYRERGVPWASWSCCYDYFYEVWKKPDSA